MTRVTSCIAAVIGVLLTISTLAAPSIYPTGTTTYDPTQTWNGYTVLTVLGKPGALVIDMNGNVLKQWEGLNNSAGGPARILPNGEIISASGTRPQHQESLALVQLEFAGKELWRLSGAEEIEIAEGEKVKSLRQHHDWQREDFPAGYYSPEAKPKSKGANTLVLTHTNADHKDISDLTLEDDRIIEYSPNGKVLWQWLGSDHVDEYGFDAAARAAIKSGAGAFAGPTATTGTTAAPRRDFDWLHINSATYVGPNKWFDAGDQRFAPNNVIISSRQASFVAIIARNGKVVWRIGPDFTQSAEQRKIGQMIGQHHAHIIPKGLPGAGNLLVFDNGGVSGYGYITPMASNGYGALARASSRVVEINPSTLEMIWSYAAGDSFYAANISSAQRLANGNTLITEGPSGRVFEVTAAKKIVWEYISTTDNKRNAVYRAYRVPYDWIPQLTKPTEKAVTPPPLSDFTVK
jgi:Arylsulfotransferase (ASST)